MKIEKLYPEVCNLFGDISNIKYLKKCLPDAEIIKTEINSEPAFVTQDIDMIYMGPMPENIQEVAIRKFRPYKEKFVKIIWGRNRRTNEEKCCIFSNRKCS